MPSEALEPSWRRKSRPVAANWRTVAVVTPILLIALVAGVSLVSRAATSSAAPPPQVREFTLTAGEFDHEIMPGTTVKAWGYNGQVPGPEIRVREGDTVRITLVNNLPVGTTIHWHGIRNTPEMDGPAGLNQAPVEPDEEFVYEFIADAAGSRMYHSHTDVTNQVALGLYGPLIVEPRKPNKTYDREHTYMLSEWDMELTPDVATGKAPIGPRDAALRGGELGTDLFLMNGHAHDAIDPLTIAEGEHVLVRLMNIGNVPHPIHTHGHSFKIVATDGNPVPEAAQLTKDTVLIGPGERYDIELVGDNPGIWMFHCHIESHAANGMMTEIAYDGAVPSGPYGAMNMPTQTDHHQHEAPAEAATPVVTEPSTPAAATDAPGAETTVALRDDRFDAATVTVKAGSSVTWKNEGSHFHSVAAMDGTFASATLAPGESFTVHFTVPGTYGYMCKQHARQGMFAKVVVT